AVPFKSSPSLPRPDRLLSNAPLVPGNGSFGAGRLFIIDIKEGSPTFGQVLKEFVSPLGEGAAPRLGTAIVRIPNTDTVLVSAPLACVEGCEDSFPYPRRGKVYKYNLIEMLSWPNGAEIPNAGSYLFAAAPEDLSGWGFFNAGQFGHAIEYFVQNSVGYVAITSPYEGSVTIYRYSDAQAVGQFYVYSGSSSEQFGYSIKSLGDLNGDGQTEFAIGAPQIEYCNGTGTGAVFFLTFRNSGSVTTRFVGYPDDSWPSYVCATRDSGYDSGPDSFGTSLAVIDSSHLVVGAPQQKRSSSELRAGAFYTFNRVSDPYVPFEQMGGANFLKDYLSGAGIDADMVQSVCGTSLSYVDGGPDKKVLHVGCPGDGVFGNSGSIAGLDVVGPNNYSLTLFRQLGDGTFDLPGSPDGADDLTDMRYGEGSVVSDLFGDEETVLTCSGQAVIPTSGYGGILTLDNPFGGDVPPPSVAHGGGARNRSCRVLSLNSLSLPPVECSANGVDRGFPRAGVMALGTPPVLDENFQWRIQTPGRAYSEEEALLAPVIYVVYGNDLASPFDIDCASGVPNNHCRWHIDATGPAVTNDWFVDVSLPWGGLESIYKDGNVPRSKFVRKNRLVHKIPANWGYPVGSGYPVPSWDWSNFWRDGRELSVQVIAQQYRRKFIKGTSDCRANPFQYVGGPIRQECRCNRNQALWNTSCQLCPKNMPNCWKAVQRAYLVDKFKVKVGQVPPLP
ncbi:MAG: FG-GAP repeat protein, partial [Bdellovibrionales bacterium]|nr:FG-GAP repeat protein [Bdellovibrionales bacterium]